MAFMAMKGITIKVPAATLKRLEQEARASGRSVGAVIRERLEARDGSDESIYALTHDLAGSLSGARRSATNERRKFKRP